MSIPDHPSEPRSTSSSIADVAETRRMLRKGVGLAISSIVGLLLLTIGLSILSGMIGVPTAVGAFVLGSGFVCLALALMVLAFPTEDAADERETERRAD